MPQKQQETPTDKGKGKQRARQSGDEASDQASSAAGNDPRVDQQSSRSQPQQGASTRPRRRRAFGFAAAEVLPEGVEVDDMGDPIYPAESSGQSQEHIEVEESADKPTPKLILKPPKSRQVHDADTMRKAWSIAHVVNLLGGLQPPKLVTANTILNLGDFRTSAIINNLSNRGYVLGVYGPNTIRLIMREPASVMENIHVIHGDYVDNLHESARFVEASDEEMLDAEGGDNEQPSSQAHEGGGPGRSDHATGQTERKNETFERVSGRWVVKFKTTLPSGKVYGQEDELPDWDPATTPYQPAGARDIPTYIRPDFEVIPTYSKKDKGKWVKVPGFDFEFSRHYDNPRSAKERKQENDIARPKFIFRKFERDTHRYIKQLPYSGHKFEQSQDSFDINNPQHVEKYNRWQRQVFERNSYDYVKRTTREPWTATELQALKDHFNKIISTHGLIQAHVKPDWQGAVRAVNAARRQQNPRAADRNINSVQSMADRDVYPGNVMRMGIAELRAFGHILLQQQGFHEHASISDKFLKPGNPIPMDDLVPKRPGGNKKVHEQKKLDEAERYKEDIDDQANADDQDSKLSAQVKEDTNVIWVSDRFGGKLMRRLFGSENEDEQIAESSAVQGGAGDGEAKEKGDEDEEPEEPEESEEPSRKRRRH